MELTKQEMNDFILKAYAKGYGDGGVDAKLEPKQIIDYILDPQPTKLPQELFDLLASVVQPDYIQSWCEKPNPAFSNERPLNVWLYGDRTLIRDMVGRIEYGVFA